MERTGTALSNPSCDPDTECCGLGQVVLRHVASQYHYICTTDPSVDPNYPSLRLFGIVATIVYPIGVPLGLFWTLWAFRARIDDTCHPECPACLDDAERRAKDGPGAKTSKKYHEPHEGFDNQRYIMFGGQVSSYQPAYWFFEIINMLHKLFLCSIVVFFNSGSPEQFLIAIFEVVLFAGFVAILSPHNSRFETIMFIVVQFALLSILIRALVIKAQFSLEDGYDQENWNVVLNIIILIPIFIVVALFVLPLLQLFFECCKRWRRMRRKLKRIQPIRSEVAADRPVRSEEDQWYRDITNTTDPDPEADFRSKVDAMLAVAAEEEEAKDSSVAALTKKGKLKLGTSRKTINRRSRRPKVKPKSDADPFSVEFSSIPTAVLFARDPLAESALLSLEQQEQLQLVRKLGIEVKEAAAQRDAKDKAQADGRRSKKPPGPPSKGRKKRVGPRTKTIKAEDKAGGDAGKSSNVSKKAKKSAANESPGVSKVPRKVPRRRKRVSAGNAAKAKAEVKAARLKKQQQEAEEAARRAEEEAAKETERLRLQKEENERRRAALRDSLKASGLLPVLSKARSLRT